MRQCLSLLSVGLWSVSAIAFGQGQPFEHLKCSALLADKVQMESVGDNLEVSIQSRLGRSVFPLLRQFASKEIPDELLQQYYQVDAKFRFPLDGCQFDEKQFGTFSCSDDATVKVVMNASTSSTRGKSTRYEGEVSSLEIESHFSRIRYKSGTLGDDVIYFELAMMAKDEKVKVKTSAFRAQFWSVDGFAQNPDCEDNGHFIVKRKPKS